jgi:regulatory protein
MSIITEISLQSKNKNRCNLFVDGEFFEGLSVQTVMEHRLKKGQEIDDKELKILLDESEKHEALSKSISYVSKSLKTKRQVKDYLLRKGYSEDVAWYCIDKLKEYNYIDDIEYSKRYIESVSSSQGKRLVEYKLMSKGVRKEDIEFAYSNTDVDVKDNAKNVAEKYLRNKEITMENLNKAYRYLLGRGFSHVEVGYALLEFKNKGE